jgi:hypothetical protein
MAFKELTIAGGKFEGFPGPRDWSPELERAKGRLKALQTLVPEGFLVPMQEVREGGFHEITAMVEEGYAFVIKLMGSPPSYHAVYISPNARIHMDRTVQQFFTLFDFLKKRMPFLNLSAGMEE